jgi:hypothetical protein
VSKQIERIQKRALRMLYPEENYSDALQLTGLQSLMDRRDKLCRELFNSIPLNNIHKLANLLSPVNSNNINTRSMIVLETVLLANYYSSKLKDSA